MIEMVTKSWSSCSKLACLDSHLVVSMGVAQGYSISFLITHAHLEKMWKHKLIDFIIQFMEDIDKVRRSCVLQDSRVAARLGLPCKHAETCIHGMTSVCHVC